MALIQLHKQCEKPDAESFSSALKKTSLGRSRAYELIGNAGGIPEKVQARSVADTRADRAAQVQRHRKKLSVSRPETDNSSGGVVIPWPKEIQKPKASSKPMGDFLTGKNREELTGRSAPTQGRCVVGDSKVHSCGHKALPICPHCFFADLGPVASKYISSCDHVARGAGHVEIYFEMICRNIFRRIETPKKTTHDHWPLPRYAPVSHSLEIYFGVFIL